MEERGNIFNDSAKTEFEITAKDVDAAESSYFIDGKKAFTGYHMGIFSLIYHAELTKALAEKFELGKYRGTSDQDPGINRVNDAPQTAVSTEKNKEKNSRFVIPAWLENKAFRAYEEWLYRPISERKSAGSQRQ